MYSVKDIYCISDSSFNGNSAHTSGVMIALTSTVSISNCSFSNNSAAFFSGVLSVGATSLTVKSTTFDGNKADDTGGIMWAHKSTFEISSSTFANNNAPYSGVMDIVGSSGTIKDSSFINNSASHDSGVMWCSSGFLVAEKSVFQHNKADAYGGVALTTNCSVNFSNSVFDHNLGSLYHFFSRVIFSGYTVIKNNAEMSSHTTEANQLDFQEGGAITSFQSTITFVGTTSLVNNVARSGGAILATGSRIISYGEITVSNNKATDNNGGGISLSQSTLEIHGDCYISLNHGGNGGGIHASSSYITVYEPEGVLHLQDNTAEKGGGLYLDLNPKLFIQKDYDTVEDILIFAGNYAKYGGAVYVADETNTKSCSQNAECFIQVLSTIPEDDGQNVNKSNIVAFSKNTATIQGSDLFGGLLDRCLPSPFSEVSIHQQILYKGTTYIRIISNITFDSITSLPTRVCFCSKKGFQDCDYQLPTVQIRKGETFTISLTAVDQVNRSIHGNIISSLTSQEASLGAGQHTQEVNNSCTEIQLSIFSPHDSEIVTFFADGPCGISTLSSQSLSIQFLNCTCPIGFEHSNTMTSSCECVCDSELSPYVANCNLSAKSLLLRTNSSAWISYLNNTDPSGYVIHPNCPFDYCVPHTVNRSINFILSSGVDAQCAHNRVGTLCGTCQQNLSLSLGSSVCLQCTAHWPAFFIVICLTSIVSGILLVTFILILNMTVSVGLINSFIFYANIAGSSSTTFFPLSQSRFARVFVAWLNLDIGIDVCFYDGLDTYSKMWFQLAFPLYIISLVLIIIKVSKYSSKFTRLIGRKDPIATLATLILLSYAKLLSVTIMVLSYTVLYYPDGSKVTVWLADGSVKYFQGKHIPLAVVAVLIILVGIPFTFLLFLWQWLIQVSKKWKVFNWTRNTRLIAFIASYSAPYNSKYRFWTGLLLLVRVILYTTASVTVSVDPMTLPLTTATLVGGLLLLKGAIGSRVYKKSLVDVLETVLYFNILALALFCLYDSKSDNKTQTFVAYISTSITYTLLAATIMYHVSLLIRRKTGTSVEAMLTPPSQATFNKSEVTVSVVDIPLAFTSN